MPKGLRGFQKGNAIGKQFKKGHIPAKGVEKGWFKKKQSIQKVCQECKKTFYITPSLQNKRKHCSLECKNKYLSSEQNPKMKKIKTICKICKKEFYNPRFKLKENKGIFCSRKCYAKDQETRIMSIETRIKISNKHKGKMPANLNFININLSRTKFGNVKRGWYIINGKKIFFRSKWEANYALYLDFMYKQKKILRWEYESEVFIFEKIQFGTRSFRPDFKVFNNNGTIEYHEIKGWMNKESKTKLNRMRIYYPNIKIRLVDRGVYKVIIKQLRGIIKFY